MAWQPPDAQVDVLLQRTITRAREEALNTFTSDRTLIERQQAARGVLGGVVILRTQDAASAVIRRFAARLVPELIDILKDLTGAPTPPADAIQWVRDVITNNVDALVDGLGGQIDRLRTTGGVTGARDRIAPAGFEAKRDTEIELGRLEIRARIVHPTSVPGQAAQPSDYDVFICHASEDKADVAEPLAGALESRGFRVWLDKFEIRIGDNILQRIDDGLSRSRYGVVVISPSFFLKQWSQMELNALAALEATEGRTKILPVWHGITLAEVQSKSPLLAAVRAANTNGGIDAIAEEIASVLSGPRNGR